MGAWPRRVGPMLDREAWFLEERCGCGGGSRLEVATALPVVGVDGAVEVCGSDL